MISKNYSPTKRKAISSIIGSFFFIVIMVAAFGAILTAMSLQAQLVEQQTTLSKQYVKQFQENYEIEAFCALPNLGVFVKNIGANEVQVATIWYYEQLGPTFDAVPVDISFAKSFVPPGGKVDVLADPSTAVPVAGLTGMHTIKVVTTLGNILETEFNPSCPSGPDDPLQDQLVAKPAVYAAFPSPWSGGSGTYGYFAVLVVNPTANPMNVYRTSFSIVASTNPDALNGSPISEPFGNPLGGNWLGDSDSIWWVSEDPYTSTPAGITIPAYSVQEFVAKVFPTGSVKPSPINTVNTNTLTSFGQFGGIKIDTIDTLGSNFGVPNIFMVTCSTCTAPTYIINSPPVTNPQTIYVALHNSSAVKDRLINAGTKLVINIPAAFTILTPDVLAGSGGFDAGPDLVTFDDNSEQLTFNLSGIMIEGGHAWIGIEIEPPKISTDSVYIFHSYAYGSSTDGLPGPPVPDTEILGPIAEFALKVCKPLPAGCTP